MIKDGRSKVFGPRSDYWSMEYEIDLTADNQRWSSCFSV
jgi:hypothetical protein